MKRIIGFFTTAFLALTITGVSFASQDEMMKKQPSMMSKKTTTSKSTTTRKYRKRSNHRKFYKNLKGRKMVRKSTAR